VSFRLFRHSSVRHAQGFRLVQAIFVCTTLKALVFEPPFALKLSIEINHFVLNATIGFYRPDLKMGLD